MKTIKKLTAAFAALVMITLVGACSSSNDDGGSITGPAEDTPNPATKYYDASFSIERFYVNGDCDGGALPDKGELSYGIQVMHETAPGTGVYKHVKYVDSKDYPKSNGTKYKRHDGDNINIDTKVFVGRLAEGTDYKLIASAIEWDGVTNRKKDSRMSGSPRTEVNTAGGKLHYEHKMTLGSSGSCQLFLYFDADETLVQ